MFETVRLFDKIGDAIKGIPQLVATEAVNFSKQRFVNQNWVDINTEPWRKRKPKRRARKSGATLVNSGRLKRSIRKVIVTTDYVVIGSDVPYAQIHNDGFRGTEKVKAYKRKSRSGNLHKVKSFTRTMNMQRRRFIGQSAVLNSRLERVCTVAMMQAIKSAL